MKKIKKFSFIFASISPLILMTQSCFGSSFDKQADLENKEFVNKITNYLNKIKNKNNEFKNFLNNKNNSAIPLNNIDDFYKQPNQIAIELSNHLNSFINELSNKKDEITKFNELDILLSPAKEENENKLIDLISKLNFINNDVQKLVEEKQLLTKNNDDAYSVLINDLEQNLSANLFTGQSQKDTINRIKNSINSVLHLPLGEGCDCKNIFYKSNYYDSSVIDINYNLIKAYLGFNSENGSASEEDYQELLKIHTHALANIIREWLFITVENEDDQKNARFRLNKWVESIKNNSDTHNFIISNNELKKLFNAIETSLDMLNSSIEQINKNNSGKYPFDKFLSFIVDVDKETKNINDGIMGQLNYTIKELYELLDSKTK
ncbi:MAG0770 family lipoprotein [Mycoplasma anserisalpingitidis]|uniref:MAG0770 family lipoprotein n=1 Tax=Mycoplasma anserisalpingitidis TaxID=519450 RepID=UPI001CF6900F|nr:hypothetical protein [Mycoplasma anserisalpingitidis]UCU27022.1 hypothetical protein K7D06_01670 [Mycoplasma anserisalpingitidis]UCU27149.1 hypothetical protein K9O38_02340 [Mycoplasma anserisalpingitidis]